MTVALVGAGTMASGTGSASAVSVTGSTSDAVIAIGGGKPYSSTPSWSGSPTSVVTGLSGITSGTIANANSSGSVIASSVTITNTAVQSGAHTFINTMTSASPAVAWALRFSKSSTASWAAQVHTGISDTIETGTGVSATGTAAAGTFIAGDMVVVGVIIGDDSPTHTSQSVTIAGCVVGSITWLTKGSTTTGSDAGMYVGYGTITSGSSTGTITYAATSSVSGASATAGVVVRLREYVSAPAAPTNINASVYASGKTNITFTPETQGAPASTYNVQRSLDNSNWYTVIKNALASGLIDKGGNTNSPSNFGATPIAIGNSTGLLATSVEWPGGPLSDITLKLNKVGAPTDNFAVYIYNDNSGVPGTTLLDSYSVTSASLTTTATEYTFSLSSSATAQKIWIVVSRSGSIDGSNYYQITAAQYPGTDSMYYISSWNSSPSTIGFRIGPPLDNGTTYYYRVQAINSQGYANSTSVSVVPVAFYRINTFEGGSNGTTITPGNSGGVSGNAFDSVFGAATYQTSAAMTGTLGLLGVNTSGYASWSTPSVILYSRFYWRVSALPSTSVSFFTATIFGGTTAISTTTTGIVTLLSSNATPGSVTTTTTLAANTIYRFEIAWTGTQVILRIYLGDSITLLEEKTLSTNVFPSQMQAGGGSTLGGYQIDNFEVTETDWLGPYLPTPPFAAFGVPL